jgi:hypothetical protein
MLPDSERRASKEDGGRRISQFSARGQLDAGGFDRAEFFDKHGATIAKGVAVCLTLFLAVVAKFGTMPWRTPAAEFACLGLFVFLLHDCVEKLVPVHPNHTTVIVDFKEKYSSVLGIAVYNQSHRVLLALLELLAAGAVLCVFWPSPMRDIYCMGGCMLTAVLSLQVMLSLAFVRADHGLDSCDPEAFGEQIIPAAKLSFAVLTYFLKLSTIFLLFPFQIHMMRIHIGVACAILVVFLGLRLWKRSHDRGHPHTPLAEGAVPIVEVAS